MPCRLFGLLAQAQNKNGTTVDAEIPAGWFFGEVAGDAAADARVAVWFPDGGESPPLVRRVVVRAGDGTVWNADPQGWGHPSEVLQATSGMRRRRLDAHPPIRMARVATGEHGGSDGHSNDNLSSCGVDSLPPAVYIDVDAEATATTNDTVDAGPIRRRRDGPDSNAHTECRVFVDADRTFYDQWKGLCASRATAAECAAHQVQTVTAKMIDLIIEADGIFRRRTTNGGVNYRLGIAGTHIITRCVASSYSCSSFGRV